jgi:hypothetical protein
MSSADELIDAAQHHGVSAAMLAFLGRFLPKLGGVRFAGVAFFLPAGGEHNLGRAGLSHQHNFTSVGTLTQ